MKLQYILAQIFEIPAPLSKRLELWLTHASCGTCICYMVNSLTGAMVWPTQHPNRPVPVTPAPSNTCSQKRVYWVFLIQWSVRFSHRCFRSLQLPHDYHNPVKCPYPVSVTTVWLPLPYDSHYPICNYNFCVDAAAQQRFATQPCHPFGSFERWLGKRFYIAHSLSYATISIS